MRFFGRNIYSYCFFRTTSYEVTIPADLEGVYTLRLIRHAMEWTLGNDGGDYIFWSCADVNIIGIAMFLFSFFLSFEENSIFLEESAACCFN